MQKDIITRGFLYLSIIKRHHLDKVMAIKIFKLTSIQIQKYLQLSFINHHKKNPINGMSRLHLYDPEKPTKNKKIGKATLQISLNRSY